MQFTRRVTRWLVGGAFVALIMAPGVARAADPVQVLLDGTPLVFDVPPVIEQDVTMLPVRAVLTPLGASFTWNGESQTVTASLNDTQIQAEVGSETALVNGEKVPLTMPVRIVEGRTLIPLRFFAEHLGLQVDWEGESRTVLLTSPSGSGVVTRTAAVSREATRRAGELAVETARKHIGLPYAWGGIQPETGFDCSGFAYFVGGLVGTELPRTSQEQFMVGIAVELDQLVAGDLVFFTTYAEGATHVGVYDGAGGFIHAQSPEVGVVRTPMSSPWWSARYVGARRVFR